VLALHLGDATATIHIGSLGFHQKEREMRVPLTAALALAHWTQSRNGTLHAYVWLAQYDATPSRFCADLHRLRQNGFPLESACEPNNYRPSASIGFFKSPGNPSAD